MRLESALNTSREGLSSHGKAIGQAGDDISNVSTVGYQNSRVEFSDIFSEGFDGKQSLAGPEIGGGSTISGVRVLFGQGLIETTGRPLDVGVDGNGFFMVGDAASPYYTRAGNFSINTEGALVNSDGLSVLGTDVGGTTIKAMNVNGITVNVVPTTEVLMNANLNAASEISTPFPNPTTFSQITQASNFSSSISAVDSLGGEHEVTLFYFKTANNSWTIQAYTDGADIAGGTSATPVLLGSTTLSFDGTGSISEANKAASKLTAQAAWGGGAAAGNFTIDLSSLSQYASQSNVLSISNNGSGVSKIDTYEVRPNGDFVARLQNGQVEVIGTLQLADFVNRDGLQRVGGTLFRGSEAEAQKTTGVPGSGALGSLSSGSLENSAVDISTEMTDVLLYQRGYQANSQMLQIASQLMRDTLGLAR